MEKQKRVYIRIDNPADDAEVEQAIDHVFRELGLYDEEDDQDDRPSPKADESDS